MSNGVFYSVRLLFLSHSSRLNSSAPSSITRGFALHSDLYSNALCLYVRIVLMVSSSDNLAWNVLYLFSLFPGKYYKGKAFSRCFRHDTQLICYRIRYFILDFENECFCSSLKVEYYALTYTILSLIFFIIN
jgi:hypothetical protein